MQYVHIFVHLSIVLYIQSTNNEQQCRFLILFKWRLVYFNFNDTHETLLIYDDWARERTCESCVNVNFKFTFEFLNEIINELSTLYRLEATYSLCHCELFGVSSLAPVSSTITIQHEMRLEIFLFLLMTLLLLVTFISA